MKYINNLIIGLIVLCTFGMIIQPLGAQDLVKSEAEKRMVYQNEKEKIEAIEREQQYNGDDEIVRRRLNIPDKLPSFEIWAEKYSVESVSPVPAKSKEEDKKPENEPVIATPVAPVSQTETNTPIENIQIPQQNWSNILDINVDPFLFLH